MKRFICLLMTLLIIVPNLAVSALAESADMITVTMVDSEIEDRVLSAMGTGETSQNNRWHEMLRKEQGIDVQYLWTCSEGEYEEKLGMALASGDLPDIIPFTSLDQLHQAYEAGYLQDLSGVFEEYASDLLKQIFAYDANTGFRTVTFDGFLSCFPGIAPGFDSNPILYIRKDWLDKLGMKDPTCLNDVLEIVRAFTDKDPDGNGQNDTYGLAMGNNFNSSYGYDLGLAAAFNAFPDRWYSDDEGKVHYGSIEPEMKDVLSLLNSLYKDGYLDPEFFTKDDASLLEDMTSGKVGVCYSYPWFPWIVQAGHNLDGAMWCAYPLVSQEANVIAPTMIGPAFTAFYAVRAGYEHPELVIKMANAYVEKIWGNSDEGAGYWFGTGDTEGIWKLAPTAFLHPMNNFLIYQGFQQITKNGTTDGAFQLAVSYYESSQKYRNGDEANWACEYVMSDNPYSSNAANQKTFDAGASFSWLSTWTQASADYGDVLNQIVTPVLTKIITGEMEMSAFDTMVEDWLKNGGQAWIDEYQAWYDAL